MALEIRQRDRRALLLLAAALVVFLILQLDVFAPRSGGTVTAPTGSEVEALEQQLQLARERARLRPLSEAELASAAQRLNELEKGLLDSADAALAQAEMRSMVGDLMAAEGVPLRSSQFGMVRLEQGVYAQVPLVVEFTCASEQFVNLLAALANAPKLLTTREIQIRPAQPEVKSIQVRMTVSGYLPLERTPELEEQARRAAGESS